MNFSKLAATPIAIFLMFFLNGCDVLTEMTALPPAPLPPSADTINQYISGLQYDARDILKVVGDGSTILKETTKGTEKPTRTEANGAVTICDRTKKSAESNFDEVAIFQPTRGVIWAGALIKADSKLVDGTPSPITSLQRSPVHLNIDLPGIGDKGNFVVQNPNYGNVRAGIDNALEWWNNNAYKEGYVNASRSTYQATTSYSSNQLAISLGLDVKWLSGNASAQFNYSSNSEKMVSVVMYKQVFYTLTFKLPPIIKSSRGACTQREDAVAPKPSCKKP